MDAAKDSNKDVRMTVLRRVTIMLACVVLISLGTSTAAIAQDSKPQPADAILIHGKVYTVDAKQPWAQAVAIRGEKIIAVGDDSEIERLRGPRTKVIDAGGKLVLPGFVDCH